MRLPLEKFLKEGILLLDGGQGTELENRGICISHPLWSTLPFLTKDEKELKVIKEMYQDFVRAGSNTLMTITYQSSYSSVKKNAGGLINTEEEYVAFLESIIEFTDRECTSSDEYLVGSVGPYATYLSNGSEYSGDYGKDKIDFIEYYRPQVKTFARSPRIDLIGIETVPNINEFEALLSPAFAHLCSSKPYFISITTDANGNLRDGTSLQDICLTIEKAAPFFPPNFLFFSINCVEFAHCTKIMCSLNNCLDSLNVDRRFSFKGVYPNSGEIYHGDTHSWSKGLHAEDQRSWEDMAYQLLDQQCTMIGGCCRTGPKEIREVYLAAKAYSDRGKFSG
ncbi:homocysteine S-methyltransferase family protein LALA0_S12e00254g [Lachancea lanzarotensis]|uniref:LALA0S12e00254g1_1 n=1 Tax=Lachancea lanzarotensis TaxID=1245769 RepID=A0A0C7MWY0_9SACH|nr:uncharacterized protein LALA0_S12e00254g [Lachancea lanzarotensis]CEP64502.1 LALA0S12e00254g1_1 [Lachancea lanzarotensis]